MTLARADGGHGKGMASELERTDEIRALFRRCCQSDLMFDLAVGVQVKEDSGMML